MKYEAEIILFKGDGRSTAPWHSPLLGHIKFDENDVDGFSVKVFFDASEAWDLGEKKTCTVQFLHFDDFPKDINGVTFNFFEGIKVGTGVFFDTQYPPN